jgi:hypothetical protein
MQCVAQRYGAAVGLFRHEDNMSRHDRIIVEEAPLIRLTEGPHLSLIRAAPRFSQPTGM